VSTPAFPTIIRNTYRKAFVRCPQYASYLYEHGLDGAPSIDLHAGAAFARGIEVARRAFYALGRSAADAAEEGREALAAAYGDFPCPPTSNKSRANMEGALYYYFEQWPLDAPDALRPIAMPDGSLSVEQHFSEPISITHPDTGLPLSYEGRIDMLAQDMDGDLWVVDEKTTGRLGDAWANQWYLDAGQTGYVWWARRALPGRHVVGVKIRGIGIYKTGYGKIEVPVLFEEWETKRWYEQVLRDVADWKAMHVAGQYRRVLDHACALYNSPCSFVPLCKQEDPTPLLQRLQQERATERERVAALTTVADRD
jgi:hypothetical protein